MARYEAGQAECLVFTFKEGLLSPIAHDLKLRVGRFWIEVGEDAVRADFQSDSLEVVCARRNGADVPDALSDKDKGEIARNIRREVLHSDRFPAIGFVSSTVRAVGEGYEVAGTLDLHGAKRAIQVTTRREGARQVAELKLHQPDYGIKPYKAMLGTLKVQPTVEIQVSVPVP